MVYSKLHLNFENITFIY